MTRNNPHVIHVYMCRHSLWMAAGRPDVPGSHHEMSTWDALLHHLPPPQSTFFWLPAPWHADARNKHEWWMIKLVLVSFEDIQFGVHPNHDHSLTRTIGIMNEWWLRRLQYITGTYLALFWTKQRQITFCYGVGTALIQILDPDLHPHQCPLRQITWFLGNVDGDISHGKCQTISVSRYIVATYKGA